MFSLFKKYFVPHEHNDLKPHFLRTKITVFILGLILFAEILFLFPVANILTSTDFFGTILSNTLIDSTNLEREKINIPSLSINITLEEAARLKAQDMADKSYFAHTSPEGVTPWFWLDEAGYDYYRAGENLAVNFIDSNDVHDAWMESIHHKENIINPGYTEIGIATAKGLYNGNEAVFVVQFFGQSAPPINTVKTETQEPDISPTPLLVVEATPLPTVSVLPPDADNQIVRSETTTENPTLIVSDTDEDSFVQPSAQVGQYSNFVEKIVSTPKNTANKLLSVLIVVVMLALGLTIFIRRETQHTHMIINGVILLIIITSLIALNQHISLLNTSIF